MTICFIRSRTRKTYRVWFLILQKHPPKFKVDKAYFLVFFYTIRILDKAFEGIAPQRNLLITPSGDLFGNKKSQKHGFWDFEQDQAWSQRRGGFFNPMSPAVRSTSRFTSRSSSSMSSSLFNSPLRELK